MDDLGVGLEIGEQLLRAHHSQGHRVEWTPVASADGKVGVLAAFLTIALIVQIVRVRDGVGLDLGHGGCVLERMIGGIPTLVALDAKDADRRALWGLARGPRIVSAQNADVHAERLQQRLGKVPIVAVGARRVYTQKVAQGLRDFRASPIVQRDSVRLSMLDGCQHALLGPHGFLLESADGTRVCTACGPGRHLAKRMYSSAR